MGLAFQPLHFLPHSLHGGLDGATVLPWEQRFRPVRHFSFGHEIQQTCLQAGDQYPNIHLNNGKAKGKHKSKDGPLSSEISLP
jgi:hypothetical protein